ncbi:hypothetical protein REPUB_Repub02eG0286200 [Reevesia pubescens]
MKILSIALPAALALAAVIHAIWDRLNWQRLGYQCQYLTWSQNGEFDHPGKKVLSSVFTSLALAAGLGIALAIALSVGLGFLMNIMGIPVDSPMRGPAEQFLTWRAFAAPPIVISLAAQGTFRGFKDTKTPFNSAIVTFFLELTGAGTLLNAILDANLIFPIGFGIASAAVATVISEHVNNLVNLMILVYLAHNISANFGSSIDISISTKLSFHLFFTRYLIAIILLWKLNGKVVLISPNID